MVLQGIQVFQDVTQRCLDLLLDKYLHCGEHAVQIMHNLSSCLTRCGIPALELREGIEIPCYKIIVLETEQTT